MYCRYCYSTDGHLEKCDRPQTASTWLTWTAVIVTFVCFAAWVIIMALTVGPAIWNG